MMLIQAVFRDIYPRKSCGWFPVWKEEGGGDTDDQDPGLLPRGAVGGGGGGGAGPLQVTCAKHLMTDKQSYFE